MTELYQPSPALAVIVGDTPLSWVKIIELVGDHIRENDLETEPPYIHTDAALRALVDRDKVSAKELTEVLKNHITPQEKMPDG